MNSLPDSAEQMDNPQLALVPCEDSKGSETDEASKKVLFAGGRNIGATGEPKSVSSKKIEPLGSMVGNLTPAAEPDFFPVSAKLMLHERCLNTMASVSTTLGAETPLGIHMVDKEAFFHFPDGAEGFRRHEHA